MLYNIDIPRKQIIRCLLFLASIKIFWFVFFVIFRNPLWPAHEVINGIALASGDSAQYFGPIDSFVDGNGYSSVCRMPGLLPIYGFLRLLFEPASAKIAVALLQVLGDIITSLMLCILAVRITGNRKAFFFTALLYGVSTFVSIRSNYLLSDSFSISTLIAGIYFLSTYLLFKEKKHLWIAGFFLAWSVFFRPVDLLIYGSVGLAILFYQRGKILPTMKLMAIILTPLLISIGIWTSKNVLVNNQIIFLQAPMEDCFSQYTKQHQAISSLLITMGEDFQQWSPESGAEWFLTKDDTDPGMPFKEEDLTSVYNYDSLIILRREFSESLKSNDSDRKSYLASVVVTKSSTYKEAFKNEKPMRYYLINRLKFIQMLLFPSRLDDLPLPAASQMNLLQKVAKGTSFLALLLVNFMAVFSLIYFVIRRNFSMIVWASFGFIFALTLGFIGYIEQRYLTPAYPFFCILTVALILDITARFKIKQSAIAN